MHSSRKKVFSSLLDHFPFFHFKSQEHWHSKVKRKFLLFLSLFSNINYSTCCTMHTVCNYTSYINLLFWQEKVEWIEEPVDRNVKQGTVDEVTFTAKLSVKGKKAKWYIRNQVGNINMVIPKLKLLFILSLKNCRVALHSVVKWTNFQF